MLGILWEQEVGESWEQGGAILSSRGRKHKCMDGRD